MTLNHKRKLFFSRIGWTISFAKRFIQYNDRFNEFAKLEQIRKDLIPKVAEEQRLRPESGGTYYLKGKLDLLNEILDARFIRETKTSGRRN